MNKPKIFLNVGTYLPGYRGGGPTQSVKNLVGALSDEFDFYIFTANHDFGVKEPYQNIDTDEWNECNGVNIFYSSDKNKKKNLKNILKKHTFALLFLNSFFNTDTIRILTLRKQLNLKTAIILMPRGELSEGALNIKKNKKILYLKISKAIALLNDINYLTTADDEYAQVQKLLKTDKINKVSNIPNTEKKIILNTKVKGSLKIVFLSRITHKKNLDFALETFKKCEGNILFDIYGTIENKDYWKKCKEIIYTLPNNITVKYKGELLNEKVISTLANYDLFYFPTKSENYGHVISEALQASLPILISNETPWINLEKSCLGWDYSLDEEKKFTKKINELVLMDNESHNNSKQIIYENFKTIDKVFSLKKDYVRYLNKAIG